MGTSSARAELETAWRLREKLGSFAQSEALRVFHGPGEGSGPLREIAIDRFGAHYWVTQWESCRELETVAGFLRAMGAESAVTLLRPRTNQSPGSAGAPEALFGEPPKGRFSVREGKAIFRIQFLGAKHPGLFLDHAPLRRWLCEGSRGLSVLNTFAYTGSLSVAAALGGARQVTTLDLSRPTIDWARENWESNHLPAGQAEFIFGDYFEWLPRLLKKGRRFQCVILDPPSFSRGKKGSFSTARDLEKLHQLALEVLEPGGILVTSINSANITRKKYFYDVHAAAKSCSRRLEIIREIDLPETFPTRPASEAGRDTDRYLKGWILRCG